MERAIPILPIDEPEAAKRFYVEGLGFQLALEVHYADQPLEGTILVVTRGTLEIHLDCPMPGHGRNACVYLEVDDADKLYTEWRGHISIKGGPQDQPWGKRTFTVIDPFGNSLFVVGPLTTDPPARDDRISRSNEGEITCGCT